MLSCDMLIFYFFFELYKPFDITSLEINVVTYCPVLRLVFCYTLEFCVNKYVH